MTLYQYNNFKGTSNIYSFWNDMNEPSVFGVEQGTIPLQSNHKKADGTEYKHRDIHNSYGALMQRTTFSGLIMREWERRPFVLTRSFFFGS